jgi:hypothetical protein
MVVLITISYQNLRGETKENRYFFSENNRSPSVPLKSKKRELN